MTKQRRPERAVVEISEQHTGLARLLSRARALDQLDARLRQCLPGTMRDHVGLANIEGETLVLAASSPAWASRARLIADDLLREARPGSEVNLRNIRVIVVPEL